MNETVLGTQRKILVFAAVVEVATGLVLMLDPAIVAGCCSAPSSPASRPSLGRCFGIALLALGLACWPGSGSGRPPAGDVDLQRADRAVPRLPGHGRAQRAGVLLWPAVGAARRRGAAADLDRTRHEGVGSLKTPRPGRRPGWLVAGAAAVEVQQLEPRAYSPNPVGLNFVGMPYTYQTGAVVTEPSLPVKDVDAKINAVTVFYDRTFAFFGRSASATRRPSLCLGEGDGRGRRAAGVGHALGPGRHADALQHEPLRRPGPDAAGVRPPGSRRRRSARASSSPCPRVSTTERSSSTSAPTAGRSSRRSASPIRSASGPSRPMRASGSTR